MPSESGWRIAISDGPKCPNCQTEGFDDWWHDPSVKAIMVGKPIQQ